MPNYYRMPVLPTASWLSVNTLPDSSDIPVNIEYVTSTNSSELLINDSGRVELTEPPVSVGSTLTVNHIESMYESYMDWQREQINQLMMRSPDMGFKLKPKAKKSHLPDWW